MKKHDAHVREYLFRMGLQSRYLFSNTVLFLFIVFLLLVGFLFGQMYAIFIDGLFSCLK